MPPEFKGDWWFIWAAATANSRRPCGPVTAARARAWIRTRRTSRRRGGHPITGIVRLGIGEPVDGHSLRPFLVDSKNGRWDGPAVALTVIYNNRRDGNIYHHSVRSKRWRYTLYSKNAEELYDHEKDPHEWYNLADEPEYAKVKEKLRIEL